jgi:hypothetical protein
MVAAGVDEVFEGFGSAAPGIRGEDVGQAVVVAPALPVVPDHGGVGQSVLKCAGEAFGPFCEGASEPEVEHEAPGEVFDAGGRGAVVDVAPDLHAVPHLAGGDEYEGLVVGHIEGEFVALGPHAQEVGNGEGAVYETAAAFKIGAHVGGREAVAFVAGCEYAGTLDDVAVARIDAENGLVPGAECHFFETGHAPGGGCRGILDSGVYQQGRGGLFAGEYHVEGIVSEREDMPQGHAVLVFLGFHAGQTRGTFGIVQIDAQHVDFEAGECHAGFAVAEGNGSIEQAAFALGHGKGESA